MRLPPAKFSLISHRFVSVRSVSTCPVRELPNGKGTAFTLIEMLVVMVIIAVLLAFLVPAFNSRKGATEVTKAAYDIAGMLEQARTYAVANNTYVWVGLFEEDGAQPSTNPATAGAGRVVLSVVASRDGTRYKDTAVDATTPAAFPSASPYPASNQVSLIQLNKVIKLENAHLSWGTAAPFTTKPTRPTVATPFQVGHADFTKHSPLSGSDVLNPTTFNYPLAGAQYTFVKIIEFNSRGEASKIVDNVYNPPQDWMEIALQPTHGSALDLTYSTFPAAVIQVEGLMGRVEVYRP